jgi:hypothetical protein
MAKLKKGDTVTLRGTVMLVYTEDTGSEKAAIKLSHVDYPIWCSPTSLTTRMLPASSRNGLAADCAADHVTDATGETRLIDKPELPDDAFGGRDQNHAHDQNA